MARTQRVAPLSPSRRESRSCSRLNPASMVLTTPPWLMAAFVRTRPSTAFRPSWLPPAATLAGFSPLFYTTIARPGPVPLFDCLAATPVNLHPELIVSTPTI